MAKVVDMEVTCSASQPNDLIALKRLCCRSAPLLCFQLPWFLSPRRLP